MHAVQRRETRVGCRTRYRHNVTLCLLKSNVTDDIEVVGALWGVTLVQLDNQRELTSFNIYQIYRHILLCSAGHGSYPDVVEIILADACHAQEPTIRRAIKRQIQVLKLGTINGREAMDYRLGNRVVTDDYRFFLATSHVDNALIHRRRACALVADGIAGIGSSAMHSVKDPLICDFNTIHLRIGLTIGYCQGIERNSH